MSAQRGQLCDVCRKLDLSLTNNRGDKASYSLGRYYDVWRKTVEKPFCPFCRLVYSYAARSPAAFTHGITLEWRPKSGFNLQMDGFNIVFLNEDVALSPYGSARELKQQIDYALVKKWLHLCESTHGKACAPRSDIVMSAQNRQGLKTLRLIDVQDQCIVIGQPGVQYMALSYVWGQVRQLRLLHENLGRFTTKGGLPREDLSRTINEAIDFVRAIGQRYLWVDCLCLIQDDDEDKADGISKMDLVYQGAYLTIVAAHGDDANAGLPGVQGSNRIVNQLVEEVEPGIRMTIVEGVYDALNASPHSSRAWTLQEFVLSHRLLIFRNNRLYFRCRQNCWSDDTIFDRFPTQVNEALDSGSKIEFLEENTPRPLDRLNWLLFRYSGRSLTLQSDMINGFSGILRNLAIQMKSGLLEGIHTVSFDIGLLFWDPFHNGSKLGRRHGFPSWSWAGWHGNKLNFGNFLPHDEANHWLASMTYIIWYKRDPRTLALDVVWDPNIAIEHGGLTEADIGYRATPANPYGRTPHAGQLDRHEPPDDKDALDKIRLELGDCKYHLLHFWAQVVRFPRLDTPDPTKQWASAHRILDRSGTVCGGVLLDDPSLVSDLNAGHDFIMLSKADRYDKFFNDGITIDRKIYWVLLIVWRGSGKIVAERRGIGYLFREHLEDASSPRPSWKDVVLA